MAHGAVVFALMLDGEILPVLDTAKAVIAVGEIPAMNSEIIGNQEPAADDDQTDHSERHP
jgi:hypothetical protein